MQLNNEQSSSNFLNESELPLNDNEKINEMKSLNRNKHRESMLSSQIIFKYIDSPKKSPNKMKIEQLSSPKYDNSRSAICKSLDSQKKCKYEQSKSKIKDFEKSVTLNDIKALRQIKELPNIVENQETYLPKIQQKQSDVHRRDMIKEWLKDRLLFQAKETHMRHESTSEFERQWEKKMRDLNRFKTKKKKMKKKKSSSQFDEDILKSDYNDMKNILYYRLQYEKQKSDQKFKNEDITKAIDEHLKLNSISNLTKIEKNEFEKTSPKKKKLNNIDEYFKLKTHEQKYYHQQEHNFRVLFSTVDFKAIQPESREGATFVGLEPNQYLFGGKSHNLFGKIMKQNSENQVWDILPSLDKLAEPEPRYQHASVYNRGKIQIHCGAKGYNSDRMKRDCINDFKCQNVKTSSWKSLKSFPSYARRNHTMSCLFNNLLVQGGLNENEQALNEVWMYNIQNDGWIPYNDNLEGEKLPQVAMHASTSVVSREAALTNEYIDIHQHPSKVVDILSNDSINVGFQIFGGLREKDREVQKKERINHGVKVSLKYKHKFNNELENEHGTSFIKDLRLVENLEASNELQWIQTGSKKFIVHKIVSINNGPSPRYLHSLTQNEKSQQLIVVGGRNNESNNFVFNDIWFFNLLNNNWILSIVKNKVVTERFGHSVATQKDALIIFGGMNMGSYCSNKIQLANFNQTTVRFDENKFYALNIMKKLEEAEIKNNLSKQISQREGKDEIDNQINLPTINSNNKINQFDATMQNKFKF